MRVRSIALPASLFLAVLLAGCGGGASGPSSTPSDVDDHGGGSPGAADCVVGEWSADVDDIAAQLLAFYVENGLPATAADAEGSILLRIDGDSRASVTQDVTIRADAELNGMQLTIVQRHSGEGSGAWSVDDDSLQFPEWNEGTLLIEQDVTLGGEAFDLPIELPESQYGTPLRVASCTEASMVTEAEGSPFTTTWNRT